MLLDPALSWDPQIAAVSRAAFNQLRLISQFCPYLDKGALRMLVYTLVISRINYCNAVYVGLPLRLTWRL